MDRDHRRASPKTPCRPSPSTPSHFPHSATSGRCREQWSPNNGGPAREQVPGFSRGVSRERLALLLRGSETAHSRQIEPTKWASPMPAQPAHLLGSNSPDDPKARSGGYIAAAASPAERGIAENYRPGVRRSTDEGSGLPVDDARTATRGFPRVRALAVWSGHGRVVAAPAAGRRPLRAAGRLARCNNSPAQGEP